MYISNYHEIIQYILRLRGFYIVCTLDMCFPLRITGIRR